jgi:glycosyltransferase involved in cell wall biosynthesis
VYATPVAGVPDVVRDGETGFWMEGTDAEEISEDIINILSDDTLRNISKNCRYVVEQNYSYDAAVRRYRQILSEIN